MEPCEPILLPPFSEEEALKRDVFQGLFNLYRSRILPPATSDEVILQRLEEAFTVVRVEDPGTDGDWAALLPDKKRDLYSAPRFQIYKIMRDEKTSMYYEGFPLKDGNYLNLIYDRQERRFIDEQNDFRFLLKYYQGIEIGKNKTFTRYYLNNLWKLNEDKVYRQCSKMWERLARMTALELILPDKGLAVPLSAKALRMVKERLLHKTVPRIRDYSGCIPKKFIFRFSGGDDTLEYAGDENGLYYGQYVFMKPGTRIRRWPTFFRGLAEEIAVIKE